MLRQRHIGALTLLAVLAGTPSVHAAPFWSFDTIPSSGDLVGTAGSIIGWGYEITNEDAVRWLITTTVVADAFAFGTPDASVFDFPIVAPGSTASRTFDALNLLGLFAFRWDVGAPNGFVNSGTFVLSADWYDGDPLLGGAFIESADDLVAAYSVVVTNVPEPGTLLLVVAGVGAGMLRRAWNRP